MKSSQLVSLLSLSLLVLLSSCHTKDHAGSPCNTLGGSKITNQTGRIYQWKNSQPSYYYIGNEQPVTTGINGGYILCNDLPAEFRKEGLLISYSGIDKGSLSDTGDPLFAYLDLKSIEAIK